VAEAAVDRGSPACTVSDVIDLRSMSRFQLWTVGLCGFVLVLDGFDAQTIGFLAPSIADTTGIPIRTFGPIFSAGLLGLMIAAMATGPIADCWGRRWPLIFSTFSFGIFALLTARATSFSQLLALRFLTGLGLGGAMPNIVALASEYVPKRLLSVFVAVLFIGMPLGGVLCGTISSWMIPVWGWPSVFYLGGIVPLAMAVLLVMVLPESVQFLVIRGKDIPKVGRILSRISPDLTAAQVDLASVSQDRRREGLPVKYLFIEGRSLGTIFLWIPNFMNLLLLFFINSWLPALLRQSGMSVAASLRATAFLNLGGIVGCLVEGPLLNRYPAARVLFAEFALSGVFIGALALIPGFFPLAIAVIFGLGFMVIGAQAGLNALAARFYPTAIRSTGIGWALGVGRIGSIVGPLLGGLLLSLGWKPREILISGTTSAVCACLVILLASRVQANATAYTSGSDRAKP
jgi:MFS transporter, AAHS family, 4-hydroxybenzoate transporter